MKIHFRSAPTDRARMALDALVTRYGSVTPEDADVIVALGGDGAVLRALHEAAALNKPVFGMNRGSIGFLLNTYNVDGLHERLEKAQTVNLNPLRMRVKTADGQAQDALAINEVSLLRQTRQTAKIGIKIDGVLRLEELICDGIIVSTPAGSTAYNLSAHGPIIPLKSGILAMTPLNPFRPRRWRGALLPNTSVIEIELKDPAERSVSAVADFTEIRDVTQVRVRLSRHTKISLLFDPEMNLHERMLKEQFMP